MKQISILITDEEAKKREQIKKLIRPKLSDRKIYMAMVDALLPKEIVAPIAIPSTEKLAEVSEEEE